MSNHLTLIKLPFQELQLNHLFLEPWNHSQNDIASPSYDINHDLAAASFIHPVKTQSINVQSPVNFSQRDSTIRKLSPKGEIAPTVVQNFVQYHQSPSVSAVTPTPPPLSLELLNLNGSNGFTINGLNAGDELGRAIRNVGDLNGDGFDDFIVSAAGSDPNGLIDAGKAYVVFGGSSIGNLGSLDLSTLNGTNGFAIEGIQANIRVGRSLSAAGDINGDGYDDLLVGGLPTVPIAGATTIWAIFGGNQVGASGTLSLSTLNGTNGFAITSTNLAVQSGVALSDIGDLNGDGIGDFVVGVPVASPNGKLNAGQSFVFFGGQGIGSSGSLSLSDLNGSNGFTLNGVNPGDTAGRFVRSAGDINGDSYEDLILGAFLADPNGKVDAGASYVVFGGSQVGSTGNIELSSLNGVNGFVLQGANAGDNAGRSVGTAGDVNGDGYDDLIVSAPLADVNGKVDAGVAYILFGGSNVGASGAIALGSLNGTNGFAITGIDTGDNAGILVSTAGDVNGDDYGDLIISAPGGDPNGISNAGESYILLGGQGIGSSGSFDLSTLDGFNGFTLNGFTTGRTTPSSSPIFVSGAGDLNQDGLDDLLIGDSVASPAGKTNAGQSFVVFGSLSLGANTLLGTSGKDYLIGTDRNDVLIGLTGNDKLTGKGGSDKFVFQSLGDSNDQINDFEIGKDKIVLTDLLDSIGYQGINPLNDGHILIRGTKLLVDADGSAPGRPVLLSTLPNTDAIALANPNNFIF